jgi:hypothetical protein
MKKALKITAIILIAIVSLQGCKKGENDPFLSLKSRDARITGTWELQSSETTDKAQVTSNNTGYIDIVTETYDGTTLTQNDNGNFSSISYTNEITIQKDGTYTTLTTANGDKSEFTGYWWWLNSKKNKSRIALDDDYDSFEIDRLTNKELVLKFSYNSVDTDSNGDVSEYTYEGSYTYEKKK